MSKEIEDTFKEWLKEKPMAKILVTENAQMGYILEFAEYYSKQKIEQLEIENTKLKEQVKELKGDSDLAYNLLNEEMRKKMFPNGRKKFSL